MNLQLLSIIIFRIGALALGMQGRSKEAEALNGLVTGVLAGKNIDEHMASVAAALETNTEAAWDDILARIRGETTEFLARDADGQLPPPNP